MDYKKYSLENLENWLHDAMSAGEATPQEIYDVIVNVVKDNYYIYKQKTSEAYELLALFNGNGKGHLVCDKDDTSPECKGAWDDFWNKVDVTTTTPVHVSEDGDVWFPTKKKDKVVKWQLPVELDGPSGEYYVVFPDDLLEAANLEEGDQVEWVDQGDGSYLLRKVNEHS